MQGRNRLVNGFVVKIFKHYILSDKSLPGFAKGAIPGNDR